MSPALALEVVLGAFGLVFVLGRGSGGEDISQNVLSYPQRYV